MSSCKNHKKDIAGITDMKVLAEMIGDLHYETMAELLKGLSKKLKKDSRKDWSSKKMQLSHRLSVAASHTKNAFIMINEAWEISKPFMLNSEQNDAECDTTDDDSNSIAG